MEVRRRKDEKGQRVILIKADVIEFAILGEAVKDFYKNMRSSLREDINSLTDPVFAAQLVAVARVMIQEMETPSEKAEPR